MLILRLLKKIDEAAAALLCQEMEQHYQGENAISLKEIKSRLYIGLFSSRPIAEALGAFWDKKLVGISIFHPIFPCRDLQPGLYMKELYVSSEFRGKGIGGALITGLIDITKKRGMSELQWKTQKANNDAISLYQSFVPGTESFHFKMIFSDSPSSFTTSDTERVS